MGSVDRAEDRIFRVNFSGDGVAKLRQIVSDKLKEFMGDYTDDTLVEYVIVLLRNGRRKEEARNELNVFLGDDDSYSFVSWLWDHLASNLSLYVHTVDNNAGEKLKTKPSLGNQIKRIESHYVDSELDKGKPSNLARSRHKREWKGLGRDATELPPLRSSEINNIHLEEKTHRKVNRGRKSLSPDSPRQKKRSRHDERQHVTKEAASQATTDASRRLLQFAVRDAVGNLRPSGVVKEPSLKGLRSVVSTSTEDPPSADHPRRLLSVARFPNPMATVVKAVQEAAEDVRKVKSSGSVFDRLGRSMDVSETTEKVPEFRDATVEGEGYQDFQIQEHAHSDFLQRSDYSGHVRSFPRIEPETGLASDLMSDNEGYDANNMDDSIMNVSHTGTSGGNKGGEPLGVHHSVSKNQDRSLPTANTSHKIVNISVNVNTWKPPHYQQDSRHFTDRDSLKSIQESEADAGKSGVRLIKIKENSNPITVGNGHKTLPSTPGSYTAGHPLEDADSRTIFVSNVHFAATKDSLSRHFNKFGEVLKVVIVTDAATGQPKGSAYVEFMRKEAADNALSLDGTSFMSRILKIMKRSSSHQETPIMTWPHIARGSPYAAAARFIRAPFPRGIPGAFRPRAPMKPGARSLQWKRGAQTATDDSGGAVTGNSLVSSFSRSLTYVRTEPKPDGNSSTA